MNRLINGIEKELNTTQTANGAKAYASTLNNCLDLFGKIGACRSDIQQAIRLFHAAYAEDSETAIRILFYVRDIRCGKSNNGGQGERAVFRAILKELAITDSKLTSKLVSLVPFYGRWDDLLVLDGTFVWIDVINLIRSQLSEDLKALKLDQSVSLLGKWLPSINASSKETKRLGKKIVKELGFDEAKYRRILVSLRDKINIVEQAMCAREWNNINYEQVPSKASLMYRKAFAKHDSDRYAAFLEAVKTGEKKINAGVLYPYDICVPALGNGYSHQPSMSATERASLDAMWNALPNYMEETPFNGLVLADVSGSMYSAYYSSSAKNQSTVRPIDVSVSLAVYIAEKNTGIWANTFMAFDSEPRLAKISGIDIYSKLQSVKSSTNYMGSTNLMGAIKRILDTAVKNRLTQEEMPQCLIIISDMQFDRSCHSNKRTNFEQVKKEYKKAGYTMPSIIFWNVNASANVPMTKDDTNTALVSGCSPSILKAILNARLIAPMDLMIDAVYNERYDMVGKAFNQ